MGFKSLRNTFLIQEGITFLNFGSFGATPKPVFDAYQSYQLALERNPVQFMSQTGQQLLAKSKEALAEYIHCDDMDIVMVTNPSYAVNTIARSLGLRAGDEVLATDLEYGACDKAWNFVCDSVGARYVRQKIDLPITTIDAFVEALFQGVTPRTKLIFISHITSTTALILPVKAVADRARALGIDVFIDGAHAPGHIDLDITALDVAFYTGACHKWMMTPKGSSFMYVSKSHQDTIYPLIVSWGYEALFPSKSKFQDWHTMNGTRDFTAFLCIPEAIKFMQNHQWETIAQSCKTMVKENAKPFAKALNSDVLAPINDTFIGQMLAVPIQCKEPEKLYQTLVHQYNVEIPVMRHDDKVYLRYSIQAFNDQSDLDILFDSINDIKTKTTLFG